MLAYRWDKVEPTLVPVYWVCWRRDEVLYSIIGNIQPFRHCGICFVFHLIMRNSYSQASTCLNMVKGNLIK